MRLRFLFLVLIFVQFSCNSNSKEERTSFYVTVRDFSGGEGYSIEYLVTKDSLKMFYDCDFEGCKEKLIYKQNLERKKAAIFLSTLLSLRLDTMKSKYEDDGFDGLYRYVTYQIGSNKIKHIKLVRFDHPVTDSLVFEIRNLIVDEKYRSMQ